MDRRMMRGGVALALAAALATSGCAGDRTSGDGTAGTDTGAAAAPKDPAAALTGAATKMQQETFRSTVDMGAAGTMTGLMDPRRKTGEFTMKAVAEGTEIKTEMRIVDGTNYIRITMPGADLPGMDGKSWRKLTGKGGTGTLGGFDATDTVKSLEAATDVKWAGDDAVTGTIDLAKAGRQLGMGAGELDKLSTKTVPFEATFDDAGRIVRYALTLPAIGSEPATKMDMKYSDFGVPVEVAAPPAAEIAAN